VLRAGSRKWPPKYQILNAAKTEKKTNPTSGRMAQHYRCNACKEEFTNKGVQVDHKKPIINPKKGFVSWDEYIDALFCESKNLQVLCKTCHAAKTKKEKNKN
jgi:5-methylcytosine-specific restriction endonuclease McrA